MLESGEAAGEKSFYSRNLFWSSSCSRSESCLTDCSLNRERRSTPNTHLANTWMSIASPSILVLILPGEAACVVLLPVGEHSCFQSVQLLVSVLLRFICEFFIFKFNSIFKEVRIHSTFIIKQLNLFTLMFFCSTFVWTPVSCDPALVGRCPPEVQGPVLLKHYGIISFVEGCQQIQNLNPTTVADPYLHDFIHRSAATCLTTHMNQSRCPNTSSFWCKTKLPK